MKRQFLCLMSFFLILLFSNYSIANAKTPNMLEITSASVDLENGKINIQGFRFGDKLIVALDNNHRRPNLAKLAVPIVD